MAEGILELTDENFHAEILDKPGAALVDFWAPWCGPCRQIAPLVETLAEQYQGRLAVAKVNVDAAAQTPGRYGIMSIPTIMLFKDGQPQETLIGVQTKETLVEKIEEILA